MVKILLAAFSFCLLAGLHAESITAADSSVKIVKISPDLSKPLRVGQKVKISINVEYVMAGDSGTITLVIQKGDSRGAPLVNSTEIVSRGKGKLTLEAEIEIPETKSILVFTPLSHQGDIQTAIVDHRAYKVIRK